MSYTEVESAEAKLRKTWSLKQSNLESRKKTAYINSNDKIRKCNN